MATAEIRNGPGSAICFDTERVARPGEGLFDAQNPRLRAQPVTSGGRQAAWFVSGPFGEGVLRYYRRGGLVAKLSRDRYLWLGAVRTRSFSEFEVLRRAHAAGLATPRPLAAAYWRLGPFYRAAILVERIPGARPLAQDLRDAFAEAAAMAVHRMHEAGIFHADLNATNVLMDREGRAWIIDFDKGRLGPLSARDRRSNLLRLRRSLAKLRGAQGVAFWDRMDSAYRALQRS